MRPGTGTRLAVVAVVAAALFALLLSSPSAAAPVTDERPHATVYTVDVHESGNATWTVELRYRLIGEDEISSFEGIQEDFEEGNLTVFEGIEEEIRPFAEEAANQTGRSMSLSDFNRDVEMKETLTLTEGVVSVSFNWSNFAAVNGSVVRVGDIFAGGGLALTEDERFVVERVDSLPVHSAAPEPDIEDGSRLVWDGERFFEEGQPRIVFGEPPEASGNGGDGGGEGQDGNSSGEGTGDGGPPTTAAVIAGFLVLVSGFAGGFYLSRSGFMRGDGSEGDGGAATEAETAATEAENGDLLTDEDRVVRILRGNGGKMKQAEIVEQTDWSKSKVSMLLSDMEDSGTISKLRLGRENVIELEDGDDG
jgi:hypothetical protein